MDCIFCKIANGEIPVPKLHEDADCVAFADLNPQAPIHLLVVPKQHLASLAQAGEGHKELLGHLLLVGAQVAAAQHLQRGFRIVVNTGDEGGQTVDHLHLHVLGGRAMHWPPG